MTRQTNLTTRDIAAHDAPDEANLVDEQTDTSREPLLQPEHAEQYRNKWLAIQAEFVDQPRTSVAKADQLVADLMQRLAAVFAEEREQLETHWDSGDDVSTEDLRVALTRYRSFFDRLLSA